LKDIIDKKIEGEEIVVYEEEEAPVVDIMTALKESISQAKEQKKPMKKATGKAKEEKARSSTKKKKKTA
jgi:DNA end-binding protein Ku